MAQQQGPVVEQLFSTCEPAVSSPEVNNIAIFARATQDKFSEAEPLYERCQAIQETILGAEHPDLATTLFSWAWVLESQAITIRMVPSI